MKGRTPQIAFKDGLLGSQTATDLDVIARLVKPETIANAGG